MFKVGVISAMRASSACVRSATGTVTPNTRLRPSPDFSTICIDILELPAAANPGRAAAYGDENKRRRGSAEGGGYVTRDARIQVQRPAGRNGADERTRPSTPCGAGAYRVAKALKAEGFDPAVIVAHPGWGETTFLAEAWPQARRIMFAEFYYHGRGLDICFDPEFGEATEEEVLRGEAKNAVAAMAFANAHAIVAPTEFQASLFPAIFRPAMRIIHEGVV